MKKEFFYAVWTFVGVTVGAGIFGMPYVFYKAGFYTGLFVMFISAVMMLLLSLYLGEVILRTKGKHQLSGLAEKYLGRNGKFLMFLANVLSIYGALTAYIIGSGQVLAAIFGGSSLLYSILFFIVVAVVIYFSINIIEGFESFFTPMKILISLLLSFLLFRFFDFSNISGFSFSKLLIPYGVSIFAFTGVSALPEMNEELKNKKQMLWSIIFGMIITFILYLLFILGVVGAVGAVDEVATVSLYEFGFAMKLFANLFALFAMGTAFVVLGYALKENLTLDFKMRNFPSWLVVIVLPIFLTLSGFLGFVKLIELSGAIAIGVILFLILIMHSRSKKFGDRKPEYELKDIFFIKLILSLVLFVGIVYSVAGFI